MNYIHTYSTKENCLNVDQTVEFMRFSSVFAVCASASASRPTGLIEEKFISPFTALLDEVFKLFPG